MAEAVDYAALAEQARKGSTGGGVDYAAMAAQARAPEAPKGDTYTGPTTFWGGFGQSLKDTATRTGGSIIKGALKSIDPREYYRADQEAIASQAHLADQATGKEPVPHDFTPDKLAAQARSIGQTLSTPEGGGEMIGGLATGLLLPKAAAGVESGMKRGSLRLMQSALKPTETLVKARKGAGFGSKEAIAQAVLDEGRIVSPGAAVNAQSALDATDAAAHTAIQQGTGAGVTVDPFKVTAAIDAKGTTGQFGRQINAQPDTSAIQAVHENFATNPHVADPVTGMAPMPAELAHDFAINTGKNLKGKFGRLGGATVEAEKAGREAITSDLRRQIPELEHLWSQEARQITTRDAIEQAVARRSNTDPIGLTGIVGMVKNPALAVTAAADRSALIKSLLAQGMRKGQGVVPSEAALRAAIMARLAGSQDAENP